MSDCSDIVSGRKVRTLLIDSCETQPGIRLTRKVVHDRAIFYGQSQNLEKVPQKINRSAVLRNKGENVR